MGKVHDCSAVNPAALAISVAATPAPIKNVFVRPAQFRCSRDASPGFFGKLSCNVGL